MPDKMLQPQVVPTKKRVYVGGGLGKTSMLSVFAYDIADDKWITLPQAKTILYGMCQFKNSIIAVGGGWETGMTGKVFKLDESKEIWVEDSLPPMSTERFSLSLFSTDTKIVACGGGIWMVGNVNPTPCTTVEVYSSETNTWHIARDLPRPCAAMSSTFIGHTCYMLGDVNPKEKLGPLYTDIRTVLKPESNDNNDEDITPTPSVCSKSTLGCDWRLLPAPPVSNTSIVATSSYLLAIGGFHRKTCKMVHIFLNDSKQWWRVAAGDLPQALESCGVTVLESGEVMVVGGESSHDMFTDNAYIGNLL